MPMFQCNLKGFKWRIGRSFCSQAIQLVKNKCPLGFDFSISRKQNAAIKLAKLPCRGNEFKKLCQIYRLLRRANFIYCNDKGLDSACASRRQTSYSRFPSYVRSISCYHGLRELARAQVYPACHLGVKRSRVTRTLETQAWAIPFFPLDLLSSAFVID